MKKKLAIIFLFFFLATIISSTIEITSRDSSLNELITLNTKAYAFEAGTCKGAGAGWTDIVCPGGSKICCWAHTNVYGVGVTSPEYPTN